MATTGQKIKALRKDNKMSQEAFSEVFNVARQTVSKWENDEEIPNMDNMTSIAKYFGKSLGYFTAMDGKDDSETAASSNIVATTKKRSDIWWIVGVVLSSIFPVFDIFAVLIYFITEIICADAFTVSGSYIMNWTFFWIMFAFTVLSLVSLAVLIVSRVKKRQMSPRSDKMSPKGDRHF